MRIINRTCFDTYLIVALAKFASLPGVRKRTTAEITSTKTGTQGRAYGCGGYIYINFNPPEFNKPYKNGGSRGYLSYQLYSIEEMMVEILAHELRHIWQWKQTRKTGMRHQLLAKDTKKIRRKVFGTHASLREVDASRYAIQILRRFRREWPTNFKLLRRADKTREVVSC